MNQKVGIYFWIRVVVMIVTLIAVITLMLRLREPNALGQTINLCPTRVTSVSLIGRFAVVQDGMTWYRSENGQRVELDHIAVEKWFAEHCQVDAQEIEPPADATPLMTLAYVSGLPKTVLMTPNGEFTLEGRHFRSLQMARALAALETLPNAKKPGQN